MQMKFLLPILLLLSACERESEPPSEMFTTDSSTSATPPASDEQHGPKIVVWSDPKASYTDEGSGELSNGNLWLITRRAGPSGISFSKREIDCEAGTFRYLQEGDTSESMSDHADADMGRLTEGAISTLVSDYVCQKHDRGGVDAA